MQIIILYILFIIVNLVFCTVHLEWFNSFFQNRMINKNEEINYFDAENLIRNFGYEYEEHDVLTDDGYWLTIHRISSSEDRVDNKTRKPAVLIHHGFLAASDNFLFRGRGKDLPYVLVDAGFDVWMCNARGNFYSRRHVNYNPNVDMNYWKFSFHEMGLYDLPATVNHVLHKTNESRLYFIGYSMGATVSYILCSNKPEYNDKFKLLISLAPTAITAHQFKPFFKLLLTAVQPTVKLLESGNAYEFFPRSSVTKNLLEAFCNATTVEACLSMLFMAVGKDYEEFSKTLIPSIIKYYPAGTSIYTVYHYYQMFTTGSFAPLLTDINGNDSVKMSYNLSRISAPVAIYCGEGDYVVSKEDCKLLMKTLPNSVGLFKINHKHFNHLDFMWATNAKSLLYDDIINIMNQFR